MSDDFYGKRKPIKPRSGPYRLKPNSAKREAWFYTNKGSIDVCLYTPDVGTDMVRVPLKTLKRIVAVLDRKPAGARK